jgi:hypothetical protein
MAAFLDGDPWLGSARALCSLSRTTIPAWCLTTVLCPKPIENDRQQPTCRIGATTELTGGAEDADDKVHDVLDGDIRTDSTLRLSPGQQNPHGPVQIIGELGVRLM